MASRRNHPAGQTRGECQSCQMMTMIFATSTNLSMNLTATLAAAMAWLKMWLRRLVDGAGTMTSLERALTAVDQGSAKIRKHSNGQDPMRRRNNTHTGTVD